MSKWNLPIERGPYLHEDLTNYLMLCKVGKNSW